MADQPLFTQLFASALYSLTGGPGWVGFIYTGGGDLPATIDFKSSFNAGYYLFAPVAPPVADTATATNFVTAVQVWLNQNFGGSFQQFNGSACVWLPDATGPVFGPPNQSAIAFSATGSATSTASNFNLQMGQLTLSIPQGVVVNANERGLLFPPIGQKISFNVTAGNNAPSVLGNVSLPFVGGYAGALTMQGTISRAGDPGVISYFATGFHYLYAVPGANDQRQIYPVLCTGGSRADLPYSGAVDPIDPLNSGPPLSDPSSGRYRTLFAFRDETAIDSWYRDDNGNPAGLVPLNGLDPDGEPMPYCGALVLQSLGATDLPPAQVYMALAGDFALAPSVPRGAALRLLAGLFGTEKFQLSSYTSSGSFDRLRFQPGPAYAPVFPFPDSSLDDPGASLPKDRLTAKHQTSWAAILNGPQGHAAYLAQPQGSSLYAPLPGAAGGDTAAPLPPLDTPAAIPQPAAPAPAFLLPFAPYAGLSAAGQSFPPANVGPFESQILSAERKRLLGAVSTPRLAALKRARRLAAAFSTADLRQATTPQGLFAEVTVPDPSSADFESSYETVVLAGSTAKLPATGSVNFGFTDLEAELQGLFQTNQLFSVIVNPEFLGTPDGTGGPAFQRDVVIADWGMTAAVGATPNSTAFTNILILKYCDGALTERVRNPNKWVGVDDFSVVGQGDKSVALAGLSSYLQDYLQAGIDQAAGGNQFYANFAKIVQDPTWQGFLVLRALVDPSGFPDQIKGLTAGIDFTQFEAHHFGATTSRVSVDGTTVAMQVPSSLFGLIDYQLPAYRQNVAAGGSPDMPVPVPAGGDFGFTVLQLQALFENASLVNFQSRIQLTIDALFLSPVASAYGAIGRLPASAVVLRGSYQRQGATAVYVFEQNTTTVFALQSNVLPAVALLRVVFNTLSNGDDGTIRSRFLMWGLLEFAVLATSSPGGGSTDADLLSFGQVPGSPLYQQPQGLAFSGLDVSLSSPTATPNAVTFVFETGRLALDAGGSTAREHSLYQDLALQVDSFIAGAEDKRPIDFGFLPVGVGPKLKTLSGPWFGIACKVTMGSPGGLVSAAGFSSRILLAWGAATMPNDPTAAVFVGLQLPGAAPGAKLLSIQGVLKLSIDSLVLRREGAAGALAFVLRLNNIALSFLGILKLPSDPINFFLFGDPSGSGSLGWYAAYIKKKQTGDLEAEPGKTAFIKAAEAHRDAVEEACP